MSAPHLPPIILGACLEFLEVEVCQRDLNRVFELHHEVRTGKIEECDLHDRLQRAPFMLEMVNVALHHARVLLYYQESTLLKQAVEILEQIVRISKNPSPRLGTQVNEIKRFPIEIRRNIYDNFMGTTKNVYHMCGRASVKYVWYPRGDYQKHTFDHLPHGYGCLADLKDIVNLLLADKETCHEVWKQFYSTKMPNFTCLCAMSMCLNNNVFAQKYAHEIGFIWCGFWNGSFDGFARQLHGSESLEHPHTR